jgi:enoyl-CoA hydratase/carnithine racemase
MRTDFSDYADRYQHVALTREGGVLLGRLHTENGPLRWTASVHEELGWFFQEIGQDPETKVVVITGTGDTFIGTSDLGTFPWQAEGMTPQHWDVIYSEGQRLISGFLSIPVPVIVAVNGPALVHSELAVLGDLTFAAPEAILQDSHFKRGLVPGDGVHIVWPALLGPNRGRKFLLMGGSLDAQEALRLGLISDILPRDQLVSHALETGGELAKQSDLVRRYTRALLTRNLRAAVDADLPMGLALEGLAHPSWAGPGHDAAGVTGDAQDE